MSAELLGFLSDLNVKGIQIWREGEQLRVSAPKGVITPDLHAQIRAHKAEILALLAEVRSKDGINLDELRPTTRSGPIPLSMYQQEIWPLIQKKPGSSAYQTATARRLRFDLALDLLDQSLAEVVSRHEILRTVFPLQDGQPVQVISPAPESALEVQDLRAIPHDQREDELGRRLTSEAAWPLDLAQGPLFRFIVFQLDEQDYVLLQVLHFLVCDCIGQAILEAEITGLYSAYAAGQTLALPPLSLQYADFALWQHKQLQQGNYHGQLEYWRNKLAPPLPALTTLAGQRLDAARSSRADRRGVALPAQLTAELEALARRGSGTLYMVLLAAFGIFLADLSHEQDLLIGTPVAGRIHPGLEGVAGRFLNTLILRLDLSGHLTFVQLLECVRQTVMDSFSNQDVPFVEVIETLRKAPGSAPLPEPLFSVQLNFAPLSDDAAADASSDFGQKVDLDQSEARYPLTLYISMAGEAARLVFIAQEGLFTAAQLDAFLQQMKSLLEAIVQDPGRPIWTYRTGAKLDVLSADVQLASRRELPGSPPEGQADELTFAVDPHGEGKAWQARQDSIERGLMEIWKRLLKVDDVHASDNFFALGGSSLLAMRMIIEVHETFGVNLPLNAVFRNPCIEHVARLLDEHTGKAAWDSLVEIQPQGARPPVYFVHGITGDTIWFEKFARYLNPDQPIYGLQARGLDGHQPPQESIEEMAQLYLREIRRLQPSGPYYLAGYSSGGMIAYEMACQLQDAGQETAMLMVIDQANPKSDYYTVRLSPRLFTNILYNLPSRLSDIIKMGRERILNRLGSKLRYFLMDIKQAIQAPKSGPRGRSVDELTDYASSLPEHTRKIIEISYAALSNYNPRPYPGKLTLVRARGARLLASHDPKMGWGETVKAVDVRIVPGSHWGMFLEPRIRDLSAIIQASLDDAQAMDRPKTLKEKELNENKSQ